MRACQHCGLSIGDGAAFCPVCGTPAGSESTSPAAEPRPAQPIVSCMLCGHPGPLVDVEKARVCARCREAVELLVDRETHEGFSIHPITTEDEERRATARTAAAVYSALLDGATCKACDAMDGKTTTDLHEAGGWTPNPQCTDPEGCRCLD